MNVYQRRHQAVVGSQQLEITWWVQKRVDQECYNSVPKQRTLSMTSSTVSAPYVRQDVNGNAFMSYNQHFPSINMNPLSFCYNAPRVAGESRNSLTCSSGLQFQPPTYSVPPPTQFFTRPTSQSVDLNAQIIKPVQPVQPVVRANVYEMM